MLAIEGRYNFQLAIEFVKVTGLEIEKFIDPNPNKFATQSPSFVPYLLKICKDCCLVAIRRKSDTVPVFCSLPISLVHDNESWVIRSSDKPQADSA